MAALSCSARHDFSSFPPLFLPVRRHAPHTTVLQKVSDQLRKRKGDNAAFVVTSLAPRIRKKRPHLTHRSGSKKDWQGLLRVGLNDADIGNSALRSRHRETRNPRRPHLKSQEVQLRVAGCEINNLLPTTRPYLHKQRRTATENALDIQPIPICNCCLPNPARNINHVVVPHSRELAFKRGIHIADPSGERLSPRHENFFAHFFPVGASEVRAAMNASWGTSTRPIAFMRFLPSFCFSRSLRLREMSPP